MIVYKVEHSISSLIYLVQLRLGIFFKNLQHRCYGMNKNVRTQKSQGTKIYKGSHKGGQFKVIYLIVFNVLQTVGFMYVLYLMTMLYSQLGYASFAFTYDQLGFIVKLLHIMQILEILHPIIGYTKGGPTVPFFQLFGRLIILFIMVEPEPRVQTKPIIPYLFMVWGTIEVIRHAYYISQLINMEISLLKWLRYSAWIILYPMGIFGEATVMVKNIPYFQETMRYSITLPNTWNFSLDAVFLLRLQIFILICPTMYMLTSHMYKMRVKKMADFKWN